MRTIFLLAIAPLVLAQTIEGPTFEVASVRKVTDGESVVALLFGGPGTSSPGRARMRLSVHPLLYEAFDLPLNSFVNLDKLPPTWFEFEAVVPEGATKADYRHMLRNFLVERFHMQFHRETRTIPVYELRVARGGHKLTPTANETPEPGGLSVKPTSDGYLTFAKGMNSPFYFNGSKASVQRVHTTMEEFAAALDKDFLHAPVVNLTGLTGQYDFYLRFEARREKADSAEFLDPPLEPAMQSQLGLLLTQGKQPREVIVIDAFDKQPTAN